MSTPRRKQPVRTVCLTKNSEYHLRDGVCVGVRDRRSGSWLASHHALDRTLAGALIYRDGDIVLCSTPTAGDHLVFEGGCAVTSAIEAVSKETGPADLPIPQDLPMGERVPDWAARDEDVVDDEEPTEDLVRRAG